MLLALALDLRRRRLNIFFLIFLPVVMIEPDVSESVSLEELELSDEDEESKEEEEEEKKRRRGGEEEEKRSRRGVEE